MKAEIQLIAEGAVDGDAPGSSKWATTQTDDDPLDAYSRAVITAAEKVSPSVVYIEVAQAVRSRRSNALRLPQERRGNGSFENNSPARKGGLREGDIIIGLDNQPLKGIDDLHKLLTEERIGRTSSLLIIRGTEKLSIEVRPEESSNRDSD